MITPDTSLNKPRTAETVKEEMKNAIKKLQSNLDNFGRQHAEARVKGNQEAFREFMPIYAALLFELCQLIGKEAAFKETDREKVWTSSLWNNGNPQPSVDHILNEHPDFAKALMDIALAQTKKPATNMPEVREGTGISQGIKAQISELGEDGI